MSEANVDHQLSVVGLLEFLSEFESTRNPPIYDISTERIYELDDGSLPAVRGVALTPLEESWLSVDYIDLPPVPAVPARIGRALAAVDVTARIEPVVSPLELRLDAERLRIATERRVPVDQIEVAAAHQAELREDRAAAVRWVAEVWRPWSLAYLDAENCKNLYRDLFAQQARLATDRDSVELVWGFGRLRWSTSEGVHVRAPLLAVPVEVKVDEKTQAIHLVPDGEVDVQVDYLAGLSLHDRPGLIAFREAVLATGISPWGDQLRPTLQALVRHLHLNGVLAGEGGAEPGAPVVDVGWVLFMRRRRPNYQKFVAMLRDLYRSGAEVPLPLQGVVAEGTTADGREAGLAELADPLLLPLPANEEQLQILRLARDPSGVVVQGPPGTGKTHTIANLISHYVAYGKRVLVLAEKERALQEVSGKVPAGIRDLTVSVLGADEASRRQLGQSIAVIQNRVTGLDRDAADAEIARLTALLAGLDRRIAATTNEMLASRELETQPLPGSWPLEGPVSPQSAADWVRAHESAGSRIPDVLPTSLPCPLTAPELAEMIRLLREVGPERAARALELLPELSSLPTASDLAAWHTAVDTASAQLASASERIADWSALDAVQPATLETLLARTGALAAAIDASASGWLAYVATQLSDPLLAPEWQRCVTEVMAARERVVTLRGPLAGHSVDLPDVLDEDFVAGIEKAVEALSDGGKLGMFARAAKSALERCQVDGVRASTREDADLVQAAITLARARRALVLRWVNQLGPAAGPPIGVEQPEVDVREPLEALRSRVWLDVGWSELRRDLAALGVEAAAAASATEAEGILVCLRALPARAAQRQAAASIDLLAGALLAGAQREGASVLWSLLADAAAAGASQRYAELRENVAALVGLRSEADRLRELHGRLASAAPLWADQILSNPAAAGEPADLVLAWQWRQLDAWVASILSAVAPDVLQARMRESVEERRKVVGELVTQRAWRRLADNLGDRERRGLNTYLQAVTRYGKTGGKYEARRSAEIRRAMDECKHAVPVWVMTSSRALASFLPEAEPPFDVIIFDEASQAGYQALPLLSLAKQVIVVGDQKQTSPENVGLARERVFDLMDDHLQSVLGYRTLFDPDNSLYDVVRQRYAKSVMLVEHFRCLPDIIKFSNSRFYNDQIQPLRDRAPMLGWQQLGAVRVLDGYRSGDVNEPEADAVVELIARLDADPRYDGMSFGVVALLSGGQAQLINSKLLDRLTPEGYRRRDLQVGEAAAFQGAERDVIVISLTVAPDPHNPSRGPAAATREADYRRLNVAASRAKQQMWVAYSVEPERFSANDLRGALIRHCRDAHAIDSGGADTLDKCDSDFERRVASRILSRGYRRVHAQYPVGSESRNYRIDLVVEGASARLAVECDGERWHGPDRWHADHARQQVLERAGWTFERIRGSAFYRNEDAALQPLWDRLSALGIEPGDDASGVSATGQSFDSLGGRLFSSGTTLPDAIQPVATRSDNHEAARKMLIEAENVEAGGAETVPLTGEPHDPTQPSRATDLSASGQRLPRLGARDAILTAAYRVMAATGREDFTASEVVAAMVSAGTIFAEGTIRTMISSHMVMDGSIERIERGLYRPSGSS